MKYFKLFSNCVCVKGPVNSVICDLQRGDIYNLTSEQYDLLETLKTTPFAQVLGEYEDIYHPTIKDWINNLEHLELGFFCDNPEQFPGISMDFETPELINNCIIEYGISSNYNWKNIYDQLSLVGCKFLEIRIRRRISIEELEDLVLDAKNTNIRGIELILPFQSLTFTSELELILLKHQRVASILIHSIPKAEYILNTEESRIIQTEENLTSNSCCGNISKNTFVSNLIFFTEAHSYNTCLNKKISISENGTIKNCPSLLQSFGQIADNNLLEIVFKEELRRKWKISKNNISDCKDCEFRYVCSDCRAFISTPDDEFSKPLKCNYDPYTGTWSNWMKDADKRQIVKTYYPQLDL